MVDDPFDYFRISLLPGIGPNRGRNLLRHFGSWGALVGARATDIVALDGFHRKLASQVLRNIRNAEFQSNVEDEVRRAKEMTTTDGTSRFISCESDEFPSVLRTIYDPPLYLFILGTLLESDSRAIAVVGTRRPSDYGKRAADRLAHELAGRGITIVSGLAHGVDTVAHTAAIRAGGRTIAVLGSGTFHIYPSANRALAKRITEHGCVLSEFPPLAEPDAVNFPRRNRIISGLSAGTVVVESGERGGAMITAEMALDHGREVFAVPGSIFSEQSTGPLRLIQRGMAHAVGSADEILEALPSLRGTGRHTPPAVQVTLEEQLLLAALDTADPIHLDELGVRTGMNPSALLVMLLSLEFRNLIQQLPGKHFVATALGIRSSRRATPEP